MTDCHREPLPFPSLGPKAVLADLQGGRLTTDAGALLLREVAQRIGLFDARDAALPDPRNPAFILPDRRPMIAQRVPASALGYEDLHDHQDLRADPVLPVAAGRPPEEGPTLASPPPPCRSESRIERRTAVEGAAVPVDRFLAAPPTPPGHLILACDAPDDPVHGKREGRPSHGCYDHHRPLPLYVPGGDARLAAYLRPRHIDAATPARAVLELLAEKRRAAWPGVKITIRGDGGSCRGRRMRWCDSHGIGCVRGLARAPALRRAARDGIARAERQSPRAGQPQRIFGPLGYAASRRDRTRRGIVKAGHNAPGATPRFVVADGPGDPHG